MYVLGITGESAADVRARTVDRVVGRLGREGRVGVVRYDATIADGTTTVPEGAPRGGDVTYDLGADGDWAATGTGLTVQEALDSLADGCDYAVVVGVDGLRYPQLVLGDGRVDKGDALAVVERPDELDVEAILTALHDREPHETLSSLVRRVKDAPDADRAGAIATFTGRVRARDDPDDARTEFLEFEKYDEIADERLTTIESELAGRDGVFAAELYHRTGVVRDGEDIVFVVILAGHRREAFRAVEDGIDRLKDEVPLFKKEVTVDDEFWVNERP